MPVHRIDYTRVYKQSAARAARAGSTPGSFAKALASSNAAEVKDASSLRLPQRMIRRDERLLRKGMASPMPDGGPPPRSTAAALAAQPPAKQAALRDFAASIVSVKAAPVKTADVAPPKRIANVEERGNGKPWDLLLAGDGYRLSSKFGMRKDPFTGRLQKHNGIDVAAPRDTAILASASGEVVQSGYAGGYGKMVKIQHDDGTETVYGHAQELLVKAGERVEAGEIIAKVGSTGRSTGPHLHFELRRDGRAVNPEPMLMARMAEERLMLASAK